MKGGYILLNLSEWNGDGTNPQTIKGSYQNAKDCYESGVLVLVQTSGGTFPGTVRKNGNNYVFGYVSSAGDTEVSVTPQDRVQ